MGIYALYPISFYFYLPTACRNNRRGICKDTERENMKTLLQKHIEDIREIMHQQTETTWYDSGVRDVMFEGYLKGLAKAQRLVKQQEKVSSILEHTKKS